MFKKILILSLSLTIGLFFTAASFAQDDPSTTEADKTKVENPKDETKTEVKEDTSKSTEGTETTESTTISTVAKTYSDGSTVFVNSKVQFKLSSSDNIAVDKIEYKIDAGEAQVYANPFSIAQEGSHVIKYYGIDKSANTETEKSYSVIVDNTAPVVIVTTNKPVKRIGDKIYYSKDLLFSINSNDSLSGVDKVQYSINGTDFQDYATPFKIATKGEVNLKVKAIDNVGNATENFVFRVIDETGKEVDLKEGLVKLTTDNIAPVVEIKPDKELKQINLKNVASTDVKYTISGTDEGSGIASILYRIDNKGDFIPYKDVVQFMTNGKHRIEAKAVDKAGNESNVLNFTVYVDIIPPVTEIETLK